jgi:tetrachlorobenzoquinone reductase
VKADLLRLVVHEVTIEARGILSFDLRAVDGVALPLFTAGAHIDVCMPNAVCRSYSLVNPQDERHRYVIAVNKDPASRGGSRYMHEELAAGAMLEVSHPRNNFPLDESARESVFVAGGIGITPILPMLERLNALERRWRLYYCARSRDTAAFVSRIENLALAGGARARFVFHDGGTRRMLDWSSVIAEADEKAHFYCCGPLRMLSHFEQVTAALASQRVHREYFSAKSAPLAEGGFVVELARSARTVHVPAGKTILDALLDAGVKAEYSCTQGVCGACETSVLDGIPDHRDLVLTREEHAANNVMMICCSGCKSARLVLDL